MIISSSTDSFLMEPKYISNGLIVCLDMQVNFLYEVKWIGLNTSFHIRVTQGISFEHLPIELS